MIVLVTRLSHLPSAEPAQERAASIHQRCRAELGRQGARPATRLAPPGALPAAPLWHTAVASLCVAYVANVIALALDVLRAR